MILSRTAMVVLGLMGISGCGSAPQPEAKSVPAPVRDSSGMLPLTGRISTAVVRDHLLGNPKLPGGTVGEYEAKAGKYQLFIIETTSDQDAAFLLLDAKKPLHDPQMIPWMGGYFGMDGNRAIYVFPKSHYLAGVVGLSKEEADPIARVLAAHLK